MSYYVSRQVYWGVEQPYAVEIACNGLESSNPDMLVEKYKREGEGREYLDPREAVNAAITVARTWRKDEPKLKIQITIGDTRGMTCPFEPCTFKEALAWAERVYEKLERCDNCGEILPDKNKRFTDVFGDVSFCCEHCAEKYLEEQEKLNAQEEEAECPGG